MSQDNKEQKSDSSGENANATAELPNDSSIEALVRQEQTIAKQKLSEELGREPTQPEIDRWLSEQTEGY